MKHDVRFNLDVQRLRAHVGYFHILTGRRALIEMHNGIAEHHIGVAGKAGEAGKKQHRDKQGRNPGG